jgi:ABC-type oligopeptide transport system ATPase subunit
MEKIIKRVPLSAYLIIPCVLLLCLIAFLINFRINAKSTGGVIGECSGTLVGKAVGSLEGLTKGQIEGYIAGKEAGLSAEDTTAELSGKIQEVQRLQVLVASGKFSDILSIEDDYAALLSMKYNAVFTVNLSTAGIELRGDGLHILLDQPKVEFFPVGDIEKENVYQNGKYTGNAKDGYDALINSSNQMKVKATEKLAGDASMMDAARVSAETQLVQLVNAVSMSKPEVFVEFKD